MRISARVLAAALALPLALTLTACSSSGASSSSSSSATGFDAPASASNPVTVTIGVSDGSKPQWTTLTDLAKKNHITLKVQNFTDYQQPNPAVTDGSLQINQFQHLQFLAAYNASSGSALVPLGATAVYPLGLYSSKYKSVKEIPKGSSIAIPNDATNQARALLVLNSAGLISLKNGGDSFSTPNDVIADKSKVTVTPVNANQTAISLKDVAGSVINQNFLTDAGLKATDAIYSDAKSKQSDPYINVFAVAKKNANNPNLKKIVSLYQNSKTLLAEVQAQSDGTAVFKTHTSTAQLQSILDGLVKKTKANK